MIWFCRMVYWWKELSLISRRDHCQRFSPSQISDMSQARFELVQDLSPNFVEWSCAVVLTTTPWSLRSLTTSRKHLMTWNLLVNQLFNTYWLTQLFDQQKSNLLEFLHCIVTYNALNLIPVWQGVKFPLLVFLKQLKNPYSLNSTLFIPEQLYMLLILAKFIVRDRRQILLLRLSKFRQVNSYSIWNHHKTYGFLVISVGRDIN